MSRDLRDIAETMRLVARDCDTDATALDRTPFTPKGVGAVLGEPLAIVAAVAKGVAIAADELAQREDA